MYRITDKNTEELDSFFVFGVQSESEISFRGFLCTMLDWISFASYTVVEFIIRYTRVEFLPVSGKSCCENFTNMKSVIQL